MRGNIVINGKTIPVASICHILAQGNYVRISGADRDYFEAGSMQEVLSQLPPELGLRVHRSHWVSYGAIRDIRSAGNGLTILLQSCAQVPVSRSNTAAVKRLKMAMTLAVSEFPKHDLKRDPSA